MSNNFFFFSVCYFSVLFLLIFSLLLDGCLSCTSRVLGLHLLINFFYLLIIKKVHVVYLNRYSKHPSRLEGCRLISLIYQLWNDNYERSITGNWFDVQA